MEKNPLRRLIAHFFPKQTSGGGIVRAASVKDLVEGKPFCAEVNGKEIALFKMGGKYHAMDNACPHLGGPLCKGPVTDGVVTCPWHGSEFNVETGALAKGPAKTGVRTYEVEVRGDDVYVKMGGVGKAEPVAVTFVYSDVFDPERPFSNKPFADEALETLRFPFKLYGVLPFVAISQDADELDLHLGEVHITEMDLLKLSERVKALNAKWKTSITYCLYHSSQFPGAMLLNVRGPKAPMNISSDLKFGDGGKG